MKETNFKNDSYYWLLIIIFGGLIWWNSHQTMTSGNLIGLIPVAIQLVLLVLIMTRNQYAKIGIRIWSWVVLLAAPVLKVISMLLLLLMNSDSKSGLLSFLVQAIMIATGLFLVSSVDKTIEIVTIDTEENKG